ncbi:MAG: hypothetical protein GQ528_00350 [Woeseiaceae bacterium]|nr:hypothetical protein [Woeseiaceae bacterium]
MAVSISTDRSFDDRAYNRRLFRHPFTVPSSHSRWKLAPDRFFWGGLYRTLYVDGVAVAEDTQDGLDSPASGFYIGTGKAMAPGTYFWGLIDDIRIYDRAVKP